MKWQRADVFWTIKGGAKSSEEKNKVLVEDAVVVPVANFVENKPQFGNRKKSALSGSLVGRPCSLDDSKLSELLRLYYSRPYSFRELADMFGVSRMTVWRAVQTAQALVNNCGVTTR